MMWKNIETRKNRILSLCVAAITIFFISAIPLTAYAQDTDTESKTVKVAYQLSAGFQEGGEGEYKTGQGYEYLQKISSYTGWTYEYVYGNFAELLQKLENGEIDLMGSLSYTQERAQLISYGDYEQGRESFYVYVNGKTSGIKSNDYSTLNGKTIGVSAGSYQEELWKRWCKENDVDCKLVEFEEREKGQIALNKGEIDALLDSFMLNRDENTKNWRSVFSFGDAPYYFGVNKNKPELLEELNKAQGKILNENPYYNDELGMRYTLNGTLARIQLDEEEVSWLKEHKDALKVGCLNDCLPISELDENGEMQGVLPDVLSSIEETYREYGLSFEMISYADYNQMISDLKNGTIDIAAPVYGDYWNADQERISLTDSFMSTTMLLLQEGKPSSVSINKIGIDKQSPIQSVYATIFYPDCEQVMYPSMTEVGKALSKGNVDAALSTACSYHIRAVLDNNIGKLNRFTLPNNVNIAMAVAKQNYELMSLMNRGISSVGDNLIYNSLALNSGVKKKVTLTDYVSENPGTSLIIGCLVVAGLLIIIIRLKKANARARTDAMTGLLNKVSMRELSKDEIKRGGVMFMIDIDNFKMTNDSLGHEAGDKVICYFADALQNIFRSGDLISRFGGDEFLIFLPGANLGEDIIKDKVEQMQNALCSCQVLAENQEVVQNSVSVGVLQFEADTNLTYADAFRKTDSALYEAKKNGKSTFVIVH